MPTGTSEHNNERVINETASIVANFRQSQEGVHLVHRPDLEYNKSKYALLDFEWNQKPHLWSCQPILE